jgi:hypothetical protein
MPHMVGIPPSSHPRTGPLGRGEEWKIYEPGRLFVPGVTAGICHRPNDRPKAETHPPNASINVYLVNSGNETPESWRLIWFLPYPASLNGPAEPTGYASSSLAHLPIVSANKSVLLTVPCAG